MAKIWIPTRMELDVLVQMEFKLEKHLNKVTCRHPLPKPHEVQKSVSGCIGKPNWLIYMLSENGSHLGYTRAAIESSGIYLSKLYMANTVRGKGYGSTLITQIIQQARAQKKSQISVKISPENDGAARFYRKHGFELVGGNKKVDDYVLKL